MQRMIVTLGFQTNSDIDTLEEVKYLFQEQWEQTAASIEGDTIEILGVEFCSSN